MRAVEADEAEELLEVSRISIHLEQLEEDLLWLLLVRA